MSLSLPVIALPESDYEPEAWLPRVCDIQRGNHKLGTDGLIWAWSIPAGHTCPGRSELCSRLCYAMAGFFNYDSVQMGLWRNYRLSLRPGFISWLKRKLRRRKVDVFRLHTAGDFYSVQYAMKWLEVFQARPETLFFFFTRSWRDPSILAVLRDMALLDNVYLWLSADRETGQPPEVARTRIAFMLAEGDDEPDYPVDLFFRDDHYRKGEVLKYINNTLVCPQEQGNGQITTCEKCQMCFLRKSTHRAA